MGRIRIRLVRKPIWGSGSVKIRRNRITWLNGSINFYFFSLYLFMWIQLSKIFFPPLATHCVLIPILAFCLNSSLFCIYFTLLLPLFSFSFPFLPFSFTFSPFFSSPFHNFSPKWHWLIFPPSPRGYFPKYSPLIMPVLRFFLLGVGTYLSTNANYGLLVAPSSINPCCIIFQSRESRRIRFWLRVIGGRLSS